MGQALGTARKPFMRESLGVLISYLFRPKMEILNNFHHKEYIKIFILDIEYWIIFHHKKYIKFFHIFRPKMEIYWIIFFYHKQILSKIQNKFFKIGLLSLEPFDNKEPKIWKFRLIGYQYQCQSNNRRYQITSLFFWFITIRYA